MMIFALFFAMQFAPQSAEAPNRQPQLATDGSRLVLTYGSGDRVYFAESQDAGAHWSSPAVVASHGRMSLGMRRGPRIAVTARAIVITAVVGEKGRGADGDVIAWRSLDGGRTWSAGQAVNDVPASAREGLHAMTAGAKGLLFATWLDLRKKGTRLYGSTSADDGATWSPNTLVYESPSGSVCECCHPSASADEQGRIFVMFRNSLEGNRDMYLVRSEDGGKTFGRAAKLGSGTWKLNACPMDGGAVLAGPKGAPTTVWRREGEVFLTTAANQERRLGPGRQPVIASSLHGPFVAWTEGKALKLLRPGQTGTEILDEEAAYPSMVAMPGGSVALAWEKGGAIAVKTLR